MRNLAQSVHERVAELVGENDRRQFLWALAVHNSSDPELRDWFYRVYAETFEDYVARAKSEGIRNKVREYEIETFGNSELEEAGAG